MTKEELIKHLEHLADYVKYSEDAPALREVLERLTKTRGERTETHACDLISRQGAIDIGRRATVDTNPKHFESHQKFVEFMDNAEISSFGRWQWSNGFNTALTAVGIDLKRLPSAQLNIIRCKDCEHWEQESICDGYCSEIEKGGFDEDHFCSYAERQEE